jgi:steroid delta-isomerase-like uncharacterized protein
MSTEENKAIVHRLMYEVINKRSVAAADNVCADSFTWHGGSAGEAPNLDVVKQLLAAFFTAFPDLTVISSDLLAEGDKVVASYTWRGTHRGEFQGIPPTGKQVKVRGISIYRVAGGKIAEEWWQQDLLGLMQQLGVVPMPGQAS